MYTDHYIYAVRRNQNKCCPLYISVSEVNPDPYTECCWVRILSGSGSRPRFFMTQYFQYLQLKLSFYQTPTLQAQISPQHYRKLFKHDVSSFFPLLGGKCWPGWIRIRIHWPRWIWIQSGSGSLTLLSIPTFKELLCYFSWRVGISFRVYSK